MKNNIKEFHKFCDDTGSNNIRAYLGTADNILAVVNLNNGVSIEWSSNYENNLKSWNYYNSAAKNPEKHPNIQIPSVKHTIEFIEKNFNYKKFIDK